MRSFWKDEAGFIVSAELVLVATILVIGMIVGLSEVQTAVVHELNDVANAIGSLNQSFFKAGFEGCKSKTAGGRFQDSFDVCDHSGTNTSDLCASCSDLVGENDAIPTITATTSGG